MIVYRQTDAAAACGVIGACSGRTPAGDSDARQALEGGTAGTVSLAVGIPVISTVAVYMDELPVADTDSLDAGTLTARLNVVTAQASLTWEELWVCRINSACTSQETLGSLTAQGLDISVGGVFTRNVTLSAASAHNAGDKVYIVHVVANANIHTARSLEILPNQAIDTPFTAVVGATADAADGFDLGDTGAGLAGALASVADGTITTDSAAALGTAASAVTDGLVLADTAGAALSQQTSVADGAVAGDAADALGAASASAPDGYALGDSATAAITGAQTADVADGIDLGAQAAALAAGLVSAPDGFQFGDAATATSTSSQDGAATDGMVFADLLAAVAAATPDMSAGFHFGDSAAASIRRGALASDGVRFGALAAFPASTGVGHLRGHIRILPAMTGTVATPAVRAGV